MEVSEWLAHKRLHVELKTVRGTTTKAGQFEGDERNGVSAAGKRDMVRIDTGLTLKLFHIVDNESNTIVLQIVRPFS